MRDRRAVARYAGLTGSPDESGAQRREQGLARAGNARVRRGMIQLAWRFLLFQKESALALWYRARTADSRSGTRKTMIVALARKLVIALWRFVTTASHWRASSYVPRPERAYRNEHNTQHHSALALAFQHDCRIDDPRWREAVIEHGTDADRENGPAARSFAADAHDCIMVRIKRSYRIPVCGTKMPPMASSPRR